MKGQRRSRQASVGCGSSMLWGRSAQAGLSGKNQPGNRRGECSISTWHNNPQGVETSWAPATWWHGGRVPMALGDWGCYPGHSLTRGVGAVAHVTRCPVTLPHNAAPVPPPCGDRRCSSTAPHGPGLPGPEGSVFVCALVFYGYMYVCAHVYLSMCVCARKSEKHKRNKTGRELQRAHLVRPPASCRVSPF